ncbi:MAG: helicase RepA family protein [Gemmatimonadota bacterium]|nr:helicase RepA family protein [Gemmatimonadota bacterium]
MTSSADRAKAELGAPAPSRSRFHFRDDVAIEKLPPPQWTVENHIPEGGLCVVYAPPENLKTFYSMALGFSVATGKNFFGHSVKRGLVVYVAAEGSSGLPVRVSAWKHSNEWYEKAGVYFLTEPVQLLEAGEVGTFLAALDTLAAHGVIVLIIFDTLHRCMAGGDENSARDMGIAIQAIDMIRRATKAAVVVLHHTRKDGDSERGSTSLRGAADSMVSLKREQDRLVVSCEKQKDAPHFDPYNLELVRVEDSCALVTANDRVAVSLLMPGDPRHKALSILHDASMEDGLSTTAWLKATEMKERTFYNSRKYLIANGYVDAAPKKGAPNIITPRGTYAVTANCNVTAIDTARQHAAITAAGALSLEEPGAMQYGRPA